MRLTTALYLALAWRVSASASNETCAERLPVIDLGYELHQAASYDARSQAYNFQNIRYARPPTGDLRFRAPQAPETNRSVIQTGLEGRTCPQSSPQWQDLGIAVRGKWADPDREFRIEEWVQGFHETTVDQDANEGPGGVTEDCLFLDVHAPKKTLEAGFTGGRGEKGAPVLVWIHGGGYDSGSKISFPDLQYIPTGLLAKSGEYPDGMIFVGINYRLGAFGWLSGDEFERDGDVNAGLRDQLMALEWVQQYIHHFGGDKDRVTVMGESAGGGSILLHMMAYGGNNESHRTPFIQAIPQSPYIEPTSGPDGGTFEKFLSMLNVSSLDEARQLDEQTLVSVNAELVKNAPNQTYIFVPVIDGEYILERPMKMLYEGQIDKSVGVLTTHNSLEGAYYFDPGVETDDDFWVWVNESIPGLPEDTIDYLAEELYPAEFDGSWGYNSQETRQMLLWGEAFFDCHFTEIGNVMGGNSYASQFSIQPGYHAQDLAYTFDEPDGPVPFPEAKDAMQGAIVSFVQTGTPKMADGSPYPRWGSQGLMVNITETETYVAGNEVNKTRCGWWANLDI